jgi:hypothetical protein
MLLEESNPGPLGLQPGTFNYYNTEVVQILLTRFLFTYGTGVETSRLLMRPYDGLLYQSWKIINGEDCESINGMNMWQGKPKYSGKTCCSAAVETTDTVLLDTCWNPYSRRVTA